MPICSLREFSSKLLNFIKQVASSYITYFTGSSYVRLDSYISIGNDYSIEVTGTFSSDGFYIMGNMDSTDAGTSSRVFIASSGNVYIHSTNLSTMTAEGFALMTDGEVHTVKLKRNGYMAVSVDGVDYTSANVSPNTSLLSVNSLFVKPIISTAVPNFVGEAYDVSVYDGSDELVYQWGLHESSATDTVVATVGGVNGTYYNRVSEDVTEIVDDGRNYTYFNGSSYVVLDSYYYLTGDFYWEGVFTCASSGGGYHLISSTQEGVNGRFIVYNDSGTWTIICNDTDRSTFKAAITDTSWLDDTEHKIRCERSGTTLKFYVDGGTTAVCTLTDNGLSYAINSLFNQWGRTTSTPNLTGKGYDINLNGAHTYALDEAFGDEIAYDGTGDINGTYVNRVASDVSYS